MKKSFINAFSGICAAVHCERNLRIHLAVAFYVLLAAAVAGASAAEWCVIVLCIGLVLTAEVFNTAVEKLCDRISREQDTEIGIIKDISAGAVFVLAIASAITGGIIFFNTDKLIRAIEFIRSFPVFAVLIIATVPAAGYLVFRSYKNDK